MDPYDVLGCARSTPLEEIETAYRLLLRRHHPDLHHADGPEAVGTAERTTRQLNLAMGEIRADRGKGMRPRDPRPTHDSGRRGGGFGGYTYTGPDPWQTRRRHDDHGAAGPKHWMGDPIDHDPDEPVPCPYCGAGFFDLDDFKAHLAAAHHLPAARPTAGSAPPKPLAALGKLRFVPASLVGVVVLLELTLRAPAWIVLGTMIFLCVVLWAQTSKRFKRRSMFDL